MQLKELFKKIRKATSKRGFVCDCCKGELFNYPTTRVCEACESKFFFNREKRCSICGRNAVTDGVCLVCKESPPVFQGVSPFVYLGDTAATVVRIKNGNRRLCYYFAERMTESLLNAFVIEDGAVILPIPATEKKLGVRGYNQALDLAEAVEEELQRKGIAVVLYTDALEKRKETSQQKHLGLQDRKANLQGVFHLKKRAVLKDKTVIIVDDILTTGATGDVCAQLCKGAGAKRVILLCVASVPERQPSSAN